MDTRTLYAKLATVPAPIKKWLGSDPVIDEIDNMEGQFILPGGSSSVISKLIQRVQIKDISPEYFSGELASELSLEKDKAVHITGELKRKIFLPIKNDFSDYGINIDLLDKFQMPAAKPVAASAPKIIQDVGSPVAIPTPAQIPAPTISKPSTLSDIGWSKAPMPGPVLTPKPIAPAMSPVAPTTPKPPTPPSAEPAPVMLHEDTTFKAQDKNAAFTLSRPGVGAEVRLNQGAVPQAPARPAVLEFGGATAAPANKPPAVAPNAPGATHYTEFAAGPRNVSQVSPSAPASAPAPTPPPPRPPSPPGVPAPQASQVPQPPSPQAPQKPGAIVKDFL